MADTWISLNDQYVKTSGDSEINGTLKIINANTGTSSGLLVNQPGLTTELYNVGDEIKSLRDSVSSWTFSPTNMGESSKNIEIKGAIDLPMFDCLIDGGDYLYTEYFDISSDGVTLTTLRDLRSIRIDWQVAAKTKYNGDSGSRRIGTHIYYRMTSTGTFLQGCGSWETTTEDLAWTEMEPSCHAHFRNVPAGSAFKIWVSDGIGSANYSWRKFAPLTFVTVSVLA